MPPSDTAPALDDETTAALTLFNEYLEADRERSQREKRVRKAERAKDDAAAAVKRLDEKGGSAEDKAAAEQAYREAVERWKALRDGKEPPAPAATTDEAAPETEPEAAAESETEAAADPEPETSETETETEAAAEPEPEPETETETEAAAEPEPEPGPEATAEAAAESEEAADQTASPGPS